MFDLLLRRGGSGLEGGDDESLCFGDGTEAAIGTDAVDVFFDDLCLPPRLRGISSMIPFSNIHLVRF